MAGKITTLYINDTSVQLMVTSGKRIIKLAEAPLDMNLTDASTEAREAEVVAKIKHLFKAHKIKAKKVVVGLSGLHCLSRPATLPQLPKTMLDEAVIREAKRVLPVTPEQLYISWQIISATEEKMQAFMVAIPRQIVDTLLRILHQVGLKPYIMDIKPLALARLVQEATAIVVDVQSREFDIVIMANGIPQPIRTVPFPEETLPLQDRLSIVKDELKRTVQFYNSNNPENQINSSVNIFVSGEVADEPELYESLATELRLRVLPLVSPLKCPKQLDPTHYLANIGLALKELRKGAGPLLVDLNTLPVSYLPKPISLGRIIALPATAVAIGLVVLLAMTIQDAAATIDSAQSQLGTTTSILEQSQSKREELKKNIEALEKELADVEAASNTFINASNSLNIQGDKINGDLEATVNNLVSGIRLSSISHSGSGLNLNGNAPSETEVLEYARNLDTCGRFFEVTISSISLVGYEGEESEGEEIGVEESGGEESGDEESGGEEIEGEESGGEVSGDEENEVKQMNFTLALKLKGSE